MARTVKPLNDTKIRNTKSTGKTQTLFDGGGLYIEITPGGSKLWRMKYRFDGKAGLLSFGRYPEISLEQARKKRDEARKQLANDTNPAQIKKAQKAARQERAANSFEVLAREWMERRKDELSENTYKNLMGRLTRDVFPYIGAKPVADITAMDILDVCRSESYTTLFMTTGDMKKIIAQLGGKIPDDPGMIFFALTRTV